MIEDSFGYIISGVFTIVLRVILGIAIAIAILFFYYLWSDTFNCTSTFSN